MVKLGMDAWNNVETELFRRRVTPSWFASRLGVTRQVISSWRKRGIPPVRYEEVAAVFGWTIDRLVKGDEQQAQEAAPSATIAAVPAQAAYSADDIYSPMALDLARALDEIEDVDQKQRSYALMLQIARMSGGPSPLVPSANVPGRPASVPAASPTRDHHRVK